MFEVGSTDKEDIYPLHDKFHHRYGVHNLKVSHTSLRTAILDWHNLTIFDVSHIYRVVHWFYYKVDIRHRGTAQGIYVDYN